MDMILLITLRLLERVVAVMIGGMSIYLGYRLFLKVPAQTDSGGKVTLPWNMSVILSRVGPGVFFALFGTVVVGLSFYRQIQYGDLARPGFFGAVSNVSDTSADAREDARRMLRRDIAVLNTLSSQLNPGLSPQDRSIALAAIARIKFELMDPLWGEWGDKTKFQQWMDAGEPDPPPPNLEKAVEYFRYPRKGAAR